LVLLQWAWNYFTRKRGARLITNQEDLPPMGVEAQGEYRTPVKV
jgi:NADH dehydrogenase